MKPLQNGVNDGTRTHDNRNHNPGLYQLSYAHHRLKKQNNTKIQLFALMFNELARPAGFEPATPGLEGRCSIRMSYGRLIELVGAEGFEPPTSCSQSRRATRLRYAPFSRTSHELQHVTSKERTSYE